MKIRKLGTRHYTALLEPRVTPSKTEYYITLGDCKESILIDSNSNIEELEFLIKKVKEEWSKEIL